MNTRGRLYAIIGGCVGAAVTMVVCSFFPLGAQSQDDSFGDITCTGLTVMRPDARSGVLLKPDSISLMKTGDGYSDVVISLDESGGLLKVSDNTGTTVVSLGVDEDSGKVAVYGKSEDEGYRGMAVLAGNEHGGTVVVRGIGKISGLAGMRIDKHGAIINVFSRDGGEPRVAMGVNEYGRGVVATWDKNGNRLK